jgi:hypothetical protein
MAETELQRRRSVLREGDFLDRLKTIGYHLGDNLIGFDDDYDTLGERIRSGAAESIVDFIGDPLGSIYDGLESLAGDVDRAMAGEADPVEYLMLASGAIGGPVGGAAARVGGRVADSALDPLYRRQYERYRDEIGDPESYEWLGNAAFKDVYVPSDIEESMMANNPDIAQQIYLDRRRLASEMLQQGAEDRDIFEQTGMLHIPIRSVEGDEELGLRVVGFFDPDEGLVEQLRPNRYEGITERSEYLPEDIYGSADYDKREIVYNQSLVPTADDFLKTRKHELAHFDLYDADLPHLETGTNIMYEKELRDAKIEFYEAAIAAQPDPKIRQLLRAELQDIKQAAPEELYYNNPGEMIARLREGNIGTVRSMTPLEQINPYIPGNEELDLLERIGNAVRRSRGESVGFVAVPTKTQPARVSDPNYRFYPK